MNRISLAFLLAFLSLGLAPESELPCGSTICPIDSLPKIGSVDTRSCPAAYRLATDVPGEWFFAREASVDGILYRIGTDKNSHVKQITTGDRCFRTPEGVIVGTTLFRLRRRYPKLQVRTEGGWAHFVTLPSGWNAGFRGSSKKGSELAGGEKVRYFFFR